MSWSDNFPVFLENLSHLYVASFLISLLAVYITWYVGFDVWKDLQENVGEQIIQSKQVEDDSENEETSSTFTQGECGGFLGKIKAAKQQVILENLRHNANGGEIDSQQALEKEAKAEAEQLAAIWKLLQEQEEKFKVTTKQELEEQLGLYKK